MRPRLWGAGRPRLQIVAFAAFGVSLCISALMPLTGGWSLDMNSFSHYHSPFNGLRIAKGAMWAWLFLSLYFGACGSGRREHSAGMVEGERLRLLFACV